MTSNQSPPVRLFILEDDHDLRRELEYLARECGFEVTSVRSVEDALEVARRVHHDGLAFRLALIDVMVPETKDGLEVLDRLLAQRASVINRERPRDVGGHDDDRQSLIAIDRQIQKVVNIDGGRLFLERALKEKLFENCAVVCFTARATSDSDATKHQPLRELLIGRQAYWFQKPLDPDALIEVLQKEHSRKP